MKLNPIIVIFLTVLILFSSQLQTFSQSTYKLSETGTNNFSAVVSQLNASYSVFASGRTDYIASLDNHNLFWTEPSELCMFTECGPLCCINGCCPSNPSSCLGFADCVEASSSNSSSSSSSGASSNPSSSSSSGSSPSSSSSSSGSSSSSSSSSSSGGSSSSSSSSGGSSSSSSSGDLSSSSSSSGGALLQPLQISISGDNSVKIPQGQKTTTTTIKIAVEGLENNTSCSLRSDQNLTAVRFFPRKFFLSPQELIKEVKVVIGKLSSENNDDINITVKCGEDSKANFDIMVKQ